MEGNTANENKIAASRINEGGSFSCVSIKGKSDKNQDSENVNDCNQVVGHGSQGMN